MPEQDRLTGARVITPPSSRPVPPRPPGVVDVRAYGREPQTRNPTPGRTPRAQAVSGQPVSVTVRDVLNYFEKCPRCGYPAQATATVRTFENEFVEITMQPTCGLPCGWRGEPTYWA